MASRPFLAFDLGAESGRALLGRLTDGRLAVRELARFANLPVTVGGHLHWNLPSLLEEMKSALRLCASEIPGGPASIGVDTWGVDFGLLGPDGKLLGLPFCYRDRRTEGAMESYFRLVPRPRLYERTGLQFLPFNTLFQLWAMVREGSPLLSSADALLFMPDLFHYFLTGRRASEFTIASTSQIFNAGAGAWDPELLTDIGVPASILQDIVEPGTRLGALLPAVSAETGLSGIPVVATATHDTAAAVAAVPAGGRDWAYISSGTWSLVGIEERRPIITPAALAGNFTNEGGLGGTVRFLKNVTGLWLLQGCRKAWEKKRSLSYSELARQAEGAPPFRAVIDPDDPSFLNPPDMPEAIRSYCRKTGQSPPASRASLVRTIFESLALKYRQVIDRLQEVAGRPLRTVHVIGGGARNRLLCRFTAMATGRPVVAGPPEATSVGNLLVQAMALGIVASHADLRRIVTASFDLDEYEPVPDKAWAAAYERFRNVTGPTAGA